MRPTELYNNWAGGAVTSMRSDLIPPTAYPRGKNVALIYAAGQTAIPARRRGAPVVNQEPITGSPVVLGQHEYFRRIAGVLTAYHLAISDGGRLDVISAGVATEADATNPSPFTSGEHLPSFVDANNLCFMVNGVDGFKFDGTSVSAFGIAAPSAPPTAVDSGVAGNPNGTYEFAISYGNTSTGAESCRSASVAVSVASKKITVGWADPTDPQVDIVYLHIRKTSTMSQFFRLVFDVTPAASNEGFGPTADPITVDVSDVSLQALTTLSPDLVSNAPLPQDVVDIAWHLSRMFAATKTRLFYSKEGFPEAFNANNYEQPNPDDGQDIVAVYPAFGGLVVLKTRSIHFLDGTDPQTWTLSEVVPNTGCVAKKSVVFADGALYFWSEFGPMRWGGPGSSPVNIGIALIGPTINSEVLNQTDISFVCAAVDQTNDKVLFAIPELGSSRNSLTLPWNYRLNGWESDGWTPFDVASMAVVTDANRPYVMLGNYGGRIFKLWAGDSDGARQVDSLTNNLTLEGSVETATGTTLTDSTATFDTEGGGLAELYVYAISDNAPTQRRRIVSNTATELTVTPDWDNTPDSTYTYVIGGVQFEIDTKWSDSGLPFNRKHYLFTYVQAFSDTGSVECDVDVYTDYDTDTAARTFRIDTVSTGAVWDTAVWDVAVWPGLAGSSLVRKRVAKVARAYMIRVRHLRAVEQLAVKALGMALVAQTDKND